MKVLFLHHSCESLGIEYLSAVLKQNNIETTLIFDPCLFNDDFICSPILHKVFSFKNTLLKKIYCANSDLIAISLTSTNVDWMVSYCIELRKFYTCPIVVGGIHVSSVKEKILKFPFVDYGIVGEGEKSFLELCNYIRNNEKPSPTMKNLICRDDAQLPKVNPPRNLVNLNELPFPDKTLYNETSMTSNYIYTIITSRGCPFQCTYCNNSVLKSIYKHWFRLRDVAGVIEELKYAKEKYNPKFIYFYDEIFGFDMNFLERFVVEYNKSLSIPYMCSTKPSIVSKKYVELLRDSKCMRVNLGAQTIIEKDNKNIFSRNDKKQDVEYAIREFKKNKIAVYVDNIINYPCEKEDDLKQIVSFYRRVNPTVARFFLLTYYPNTEILSIAEKHSLLDKLEIEKINSGDGIPAIMLSNSSICSKIKKKYYSFLIINQILPRCFVKLLLRLVHIFPPVPMHLSYLVMGITIGFFRNRNAAIENVTRHYLSHYLKYLRVFLYSRPTTTPNLPQTPR